MGITLTYLYDSNKKTILSGESSNKLVIIKYFNANKRESTFYTFMKMMS